MKTKSAIFTGLLAVLLLPLLLNCKREAVKSAPTVIVSIPTNIGANTATCGGEVTFDGGATVTARGVCWSTNQNPTTAGNKTINGTGVGSFTSPIPGLIPNTLYYVRIYAINSVGTQYSDQVSFTTQSGGITLSTTTPSSVLADRAISGGNITADGGAAVITRGVCWSTIQNPTTDNSKTSDGMGLGSFTSSVTGLSPGYTYYFRSYATNSIGTSYGNQVSQTTTSILPFLSTTIFSTLTETTAISGGNITNDGGSRVTARGVCWSTSENPTTINSKTTDGEGTGSFTSSVTGLILGATYYIRAYATNSVGTAYGNQVISQEVGYLSLTGHFYRFISKPMISWTEAKVEAESDAMKYNGLRGYLATITSAGENDFIKIMTKGVGWIGATDKDIEGDWRWVTGPEGLEEDGKGRLFWKGTSSQALQNPLNYGSVNGFYQNWNIGEPNNLVDEDYGHITFFVNNPSGTLKWNDSSNLERDRPDYKPQGYLIEYGGMPGK